ncbi:MULTISPECIES: RNA polymerase subunit sigma [Lysinibacillus]|uniref:RNA polymerase subunit sigma n=1 Tax=Lysinibacillus antri TaxID=2498145 RepID=A0A3S0P9Q3_9BACI|nr:MULTISPECIES: RNA polymerase subunit sigma [Lysinibacillus]RUL55780.1 RNA polymerase subunit sigma [Lysinibacillus antri]TSI11383.1 RNA polymerase subunit sigma [Lysinibacillus sp. BW-2-10]
MSLKGVELQIAIPKTFDAGKAVEQHQQNVIQQQHNANEALNKEIERKQLTVMDTEKTEQINDEEHGNSNHNENSSKKNKQEKQNEKQAKHPFKGNFIDFSG